MEKNNRSLVKFFYLAGLFLISFAAFFAVGRLIGGYIKESGFDGMLVLYISACVLFIFTSFFLHIVFHEMGHMIAGLIRGWSFLSFMVLGLTLSKTDGKFSISRFSIMGAGGQCLMMPPRNGDTDFGIAFYNAGGVAINFILSLVSLLVFVFFQDSISAIGNIFLVVFSIVGFFLALTNGIPHAMGGIPNDGLNIVSLRKDRFSTDVFLSAMSIMGEMQRGKRIGEVTDRYICDGHEIDFSNTIHTMAANLDLARAMDLADFARASAILASADASRNSLVTLYNYEFDMERIYLSLVYDKDSGKIEGLLTDTLRNYIANAAKTRPTAIRIQYALARLYEKDKDKAEAVKKRFYDKCAVYHVKGEVRTESMLLEYAAEVEI